MVRFLRLYSLIFVSNLLMASPLYGEQESEVKRPRPKPVFGLTMFPAYNGMGMGYSLRVGEHKYYLLGARAEVLTMAKGNFNPCLRKYRYPI